jgi:hypothetical protein
VNRGRLLMQFRHYTDNCPTYGAQIWKPEGRRGWTLDFYFFGTHVSVCFVLRKELLMATWTDDFGNVLVFVHEEGTCHGPACPIHRPSDHPLKGAKQMWRMDKGIMERVCDHGIGHPDPDDYKASAVTRMHGCDGCCG